MAQQFRLQDHFQILCRRGTLVYRRLRRSCLVWVRIYRLLLHSRLEMPAMLDFRACRSQAPRRARSAMVILRHPWPPPLVHSTSHRLLSPFSKTYSLVHLQGGLSLDPPGTSWSQQPFSGQANAAVHPSYYPPPATPYGPPGGSTAQVQRSGIPYFVSPFMSNSPRTRTPVQLSPHSRLITPWWWAPVSTPFPTSWLRQ
jgi:hypothetical protein